MSLMAFNSRGRSRRNASISLIPGAISLMFPMDITVENGMSVVVI
jgi:hypothetical protein